MILGIHDGHSASAALIDKNKVLCFYLEEEFTGKNRQPGFPRRAVEKILAEYPVSSIRSVAFAGKYGRAPLRFFENCYRNSAGEKDTTSWSSVFYAAYENFVPRILWIRELEHFFSRLALAARLKESGLHKKKIFFAEHHFAHAYSSWEKIKAEDCLFITLDAYGDGLSGALFIHDRDRLKLIKKIPVRSSIGLLYGRISAACGYPEGKENLFMESSLNADSVPDGKNIFSDVLQFKNGDLVVKRRQLSKLLKKAKNVPVATLSRLLQEKLYTVISGFLSEHLSACGKTKLCVAGGVFANSLLLKRISEMPQLTGVFPAYRVDDAGLSMGTAFWAERGGR